MNFLDNEAVLVPSRGMGSEEDSENSSGDSDDGDSIHNLFRRKRIISDSESDGEGAGGSESVTPQEEEGKTFS